MYTMSEMVKRYGRTCVQDKRWPCSAPSTLINVDQRFPVQVIIASQR